MQPDLLTLEQQFLLHSFRPQIQAMPREELEALLIEIMRQKMAQANLFINLTGRPLVA